MKIVVFSIAVKLGVKLVMVCASFIEDFFTDRFVATPDETAPGPPARVTSSVVRHWKTGILRRSPVNNEVEWKMLPNII